MAETALLDKDHLNDFYIKTLLFSERIRSKAPEKKNLYLDAFFGLMRNGYPYEVEEQYPKQAKIEEEDGGKKGKKKVETIFDKDPTFGTEPVRTVMIKIDDNYYKCPEVDLQYAFGTLYEKVTAKKTKKKAETTDAFFLPDVYSAGYIKQRDTNKPAVQEEAKPVEEEKAEIPYIAFDPFYPKDGENYKEYDSFLFNYHETLVRYLDGTERTYKTYVYPLSTDTSDCLATDIVAIMVDPNGNIRPGISEPEAFGQKSVNAEFKDITLVVRGNWDDGKFISSVALLKSKSESQPLIIDPEPKHITPTRRTAAFYLRHIEDNGNVLNVFPLDLLRNDPTTGLSPCVMMIEDGHTRTMYLSGDNNPVSMTLNKRSVMASAYWAGNSLNLSIDIKR